jgi:hypothetical protein
MTRIADGKGKHGFAEVNAEQQLVVRAVSESEIEHESAEHGSAYIWDSTELNLDAGETFLFVKNVSDQALHIEALIINGSNVVCIWDIGIGAATTTPAGTPVIGVNMNTIFASKPAEAIAFSDETAVADATIVGRAKTQIGEQVIYPMQGVILGKNTYVQVNQETSSTSGSVILIAHYVLD